MTSAGCSLKDGEGVSPVIGIVLMIAITVILAGVVSLMAFGMTSYVPQNKNVKVEVKRLNQTCISVTVMAGSDAQHLAFDPPGYPNGRSGKVPGGFYGVLNVTVNGAEISNLVPDGTANCTSQIGSMQYFSPVPTNSDVNVIGNFDDATQFLLYSDTI